MAMKRKGKNGPPTAIELRPDKPQTILHQVGVPAHNVAKNQKGCQANLPDLRGRSERMARKQTTDIVYCAKHWAIVHDKVDKTRC